LTKWWSTEALDNLIGTCEIQIPRLLTEKVSQTGGLTDTLKATHRVYHPLPRLEASEDGNSSAPYVQATGQAGADQQATLRNLFPRRYRFGNGRYSSRGAAAPFAPLKTTGRAATLAARGAGTGERQPRHGCEGMPQPHGDAGPLSGTLPMRTGSRWSLETVLTARWLLQSTLVFSTVSYGATLTHRFSYALFFP